MEQVQASPCLHACKSDVQCIFRKSEERVGDEGSFFHSKSVAIHSELSRGTSTSLSS
jgi:hypothetical protein